MSVERNRHHIYPLPNMCPPLNSAMLAPPNITCLQGQKIWTSQDVRCWYRQGKIQMLSLQVYPTQNEWWTTHACSHKKKLASHQWRQQIYHVKQRAPLQWVFPSSSFVVFHRAFFFFLLLFFIPSYSFSSLLFHLYRCYFTSSVGFMAQSVHSEYIWGLQSAVTISRYQ